jgi:hypothetical protein
MMRETIIRIALECNLPFYYQTGEVANVDELVEFAYRISNIAYGHASKQFLDLLHETVRGKVVEERVACAQLCNDLWQEDGTAIQCREAIMARGKE